MTTFLKSEREGAVLTLTMHQPEPRNALTGNSAVDEFVQACAAITLDSSIRAVILTAEGPVFNSGGDVKNMQRDYQEHLSPEVIREEYRNGVQRLPGRWATSMSRSSLRSTARPSAPDSTSPACVTSVSRPSRRPSPRVSSRSASCPVTAVPGCCRAWWAYRKPPRWPFTGEALTAQQALACGLVSRVVAHESLLTDARALATRIAANSGGMLRMAKRRREGEHSRLESLLELSAGYQAIAHMTADHREAVRSFVEKLPPKFAI